MFVDSGLEETYSTQRTGMDVTPTNTKFQLLNSNGPVVTENTLLVHQECDSKI